MTKYTMTSAAPSRHPVNFDAPATTWKTVDMPRSCAARIDSVPTQIEERDREAQVTSVAPLEKIPDREVTVRHRLAPHARADREGEHETPDARRRVPPPGAQPVAIGEPGGADGRPRADVAGKKGGEDERGTERAAGDEEIAGRPHVAPDPQADTGHEQGVRDEQQEREVHRQHAEVTADRGRLDSPGCWLPRGPRARSPRPSPRRRACRSCPDPQGPCARRSRARRWRRRRQTCARG